MRAGHFGVRILDLSSVGCENVVIAGFFGLVPQHLLHQIQNQVIVRPAVPGEGIATGTLTPWSQQIKRFGLKKVHTF